MGSGWCLLYSSRNSIKLKHNHEAHVILSETAEKLITACVLLRKVKIEGGIFLFDVDLSKGRFTRYDLRHDFNTNRAV